MSLVCQCSAYILSEQDACHTVFLRKITADDVVRVLEVLALDPVLRAFFEIVAAVLPFCYDTLQILCLSKLKKSDAVVLHHPRYRKAGGFFYDRLLQQRLTFSQRQVCNRMVLIIEEIKSGKAGGTPHCRKLNFQRTAHQASPLYFIKIRFPISDNRQLTIQNTAAAYLFVDFRQFRHLRKNFQIPFVPQLSP